MLKLIVLFDGGPMGGGGMVFWQDTMHVLRTLPYAIIAALLLTMAYAVYVEKIEPRLKRMRA
jgi:hypothetical protein